jgi:hypothetical protein
MEEWNRAQDRYEASAARYEAQIQKYEQLLSEHAASIDCRERLEAAEQAAAACNETAPAEN